MYTNRGEKTKIHPPKNKKNTPTKNPKTKQNKKQKEKKVKKKSSYVISVFTKENRSFFFPDFLGFFSACISYIDCQNKLQKDF